MPKDKRIQKIRINPQVKFEIKSFLGNKVHTTKGYWNLIVKVKHPKIGHLEDKIKTVLTSPDIIRQSQKDLSVYLYYKKHGRYFLTVVVKQQNGQDFIITAYLTDRVKIGKIIYEKTN